MSNKYFYIRTTNGNVEIPVECFNLLSSFALTLDPLPEVRIEFGYAAALEEYFYNSSQSNPTYDIIKYSPEGREFLCTSIALAISEMNIRDNGLSSENIEKYENVLERYRKQIKLSEIFVNNTVDYNETSKTK